MRPVRLPLLSSLKTAFGCGALVVGVGLSTGCDSKAWLDPAELAGRSNDTPHLQTIASRLPVEVLDSVDPAVEDANEQEFLGAAEPQPQDLVARVEDYKISPNDLLVISIDDLQGPGIQTVLQKRVSETGNISLPYIGQFRAAGMSEAEIDEAITRAYGPEGVNIIQRANVSTTVVEARGRTFSILGQVNRPGQYAILNSDFRVLDALVLAGDTQSPLNDRMYVIRKVERPGDPATQPADTAPPPAEDDLDPGTDELDPGTDDLEPQSRAPRSFRADNKPLYLQNAADDRDPDAVTPPPAGAADPLADPPADQGADSGERLINIEGEDVPAGTDATPTTAPSEGFDGFNEIAENEVRVIRIPLDELKRGELKYNIPIRPNDRIIVQPLVIGEYYMGGHVMRPGAYSLTARKITLTQAVIAASMLDGIAIPERTDIIRRINENQQVYARVNLAAIFEGKAPDIYLKPNDQVLVGTNALAPFIAAARGAFRFTYGMGFLYDRNFAYDSDRNFR